MACGDYSNYYEFLANGQFIDAALCPLADPMGETLLLGIVFGALAIGFAIFARSAKPIVILAIFGSTLIISRLPASAQQFAGIVILLMITLSGYVIWRRAEGFT